jgi:hypothetical protein
MIEKWNGVLHSLAGFENDEKDGSGLYFNFILSNGTRSTQRDDWAPTKYTFMIHKKALNKIRSVNIYHDVSSIAGFSFFDKDGALLWEIGDTTCSKETVLLEENEVIVGVVAKLCLDWQSVYSDF